MRRGHRGRGHRPAHAAPARQGDGARQPRQDQPHGGGRGRLADLLDRVGDHRDLHGRGVRRPRRAGAAGDQRRRAAALCRQPRETGADQGRGRRRRPPRPSAIADADLRDRDRSSRACYWPVDGCGPRSTRLFAIDDAMGDVVAQRDASRRLARSGSPGGASGSRSWIKARSPAEPRLQAVAERAAAARRGGRASSPSWRTAGRRCSNRARRTSARSRRSRRGMLFGLGATVAGQRPMTSSRAAGGAWALVDAVRQRDGRRDMLVARAGSERRAGPASLSAALRPLTALAALAVRDAQVGASRSSPKGRRAARCSDASPSLERHVSHA